MTFALIANTGEGSADGSAVTTDAIDTTGADLLILALSGSSDFTSDPTDSKSNTWIPLTEFVVPGGERAIIYYAKNPTVGSGHTFSLSTSGKLPSICAAAFSGAHLTAPFDQENGDDAFGSTCQPGSITPSEDDELVVVGIAFNVAGTLSINSSFTITDQVNNDTLIKGCGLAYIIQTTAGAVNPTWTHNPGSSSMASVIASFKIAGGADVTPPTVSGWATNVDGDEITGTLSEAGCGPATGTGGFDLNGTTATVSSWAISGTTLTLTLSGVVDSGDTVTLDYDRDNTTDDIEDAASNFLANITGASVTNNVPAPLAAGTASFVSSGPDGISVEATDATGGTVPYTYQWERNEDGGAYANLSGETALACDDATATTPGVLYGYRLVYTDDATDEVTSNAVTAEFYDGGPLAGGSSSVFQSSVIRGK